MHEQRDPHAVANAPRPAKARADPARHGGEHRWQMRLLPLMSWMIVGMTIFFFAASMVQLYYLDTRIERVPTPDLRALGITAPNVVHLRFARN